MEHPGLHSQQQTDLRDILRPVWAHKLLIAFVVITATATTYFISSSRPEKFRASTQVYLQQSDAEAYLTPTDTQGLSSRTMKNQARLLRSEQVALPVAKQIGFKGNPSQLLANLQVTPEDDSDFLTITATSEDPEEAAAIANGFALAFGDMRSQGMRRQIEKSLAASEAQLARLSKFSADAEARSELIRQIRELRVARTLSTAQVQQVDPAVSPNRPSTPRPKRDALFAFGLSLILGLAIAVGLERIDRRVRRPEDLEELYDAPILAVVPHTEDTDSLADGRALLGGHVKEPFRTLRAGIKLASLDASIKSILVTSASPGEGKSTVARNLALSYREMGLRVLAVEFDLRRPALGRLLGVDTQRGFTECLVEGAPIDGVIVEVPAQVDEQLPKPEGTEDREPPHGGLFLLPRGSQVANPAAVLASEETRSLMARLRDQFDIVIFDSAPVVAVSDTIPLLTHADAVVIVGRLDHTTRDDIRRMRSVLDRVPGHNLVGVVANDLSAFESGSSYGRRYGYGYENGYDQPSKG
jgi:Mrp family chromosome partitioning ATPase